MRLVFKSWEGANAKAYRRVQHLSNDWQTPVVVQAYVYGDKNEKSGSGIVRSRNSHGEKSFHGEWNPSGQGMDLAQGKVTPQTLERLQVEQPQVYAQLLKYTEDLDVYFGSGIMFEFTVKNGKLWTRVCQCS